MENSETNHNEENEIHTMQDDVVEESAEDTSATDEPEYETHTTALVFLTIVVLVVSFIALTSSTGFEFPDFSDDVPDDRINVADYETEAELEKALRARQTHGSSVPQEAAVAIDTTSLALIPTTLFVDEANITRNQLIGEAGNYQAVGFTTARSSADLYAEYTGWLADNDYEVYQELEEAEGFKLAATGSAGQQLTISVLNPTDTTPQVHVIIHYIEG
ncbi:MAG: hypothetical protein WD335_00990 [Candidatus Paceibacterota bacterium]